MAAGFKTAQVNAADVPATQTDFPTYVDLSRLGITTLAEAESVRVYADEAKTTEWAREIVSATEMHVKVPSLTSTVDMYVDWDGVRADYAVGDTYGRNAVWSAYIGVWHMQEASGSITDSTGNSLTGAALGTPVYEQTGPFGYAITLDGASDEGFEVTYNAVLGFTAGYTMQAWYKPNSPETDASVGGLMGRGFSGTTVPYQFGYDNTFSGRFTAGSYSGSWTYNTLNGTALTNGVWYQLAATYNGTNSYVYKDATSIHTLARTLALPTNTRNFGIGRRVDWSSGASMGSTGDYREVRLASSAVSTNWLTTEYNNQSDEAGFWGTWTTIGGGFTSTPLMHMMQVAGGII